MKGLTFQQADTDWQTELEKAFGKDACNKRYTLDGRGKPDTELRKAFEIRHAAFMEWDSSRVTV